ncbi:MAG: polysaccharide pyruvyl transferase family protein [Sphingopyxis sp.]|nr:polysaccharide pyruvyl transferase family protein [Sphingopyxis sp.]
MQPRNRSIPSPSHRNDTKKKSIMMPHFLSTDPISFGLVGTYDVSNFGDCIFPDIYRQELTLRFPNARLSLYSPNPVAADILSFDTVQALPATIETARFPDDILILTGGETLSVGHSSGVYIYPQNTLSALLRLWLGPTQAAASSSTKFIVHSVGVAPGQSDAEPVMARLLSSADYVRLRDQVSYKRLGQRFGTAVDPCFKIRDLQTPEQWDARAARVLPAAIVGRPFLVAQISASYVKEDLSQWCDTMAAMMAATELPVALLPICHQLSDAELLTIVLTQFQARLPQLADRVTLIPGRLTVLDTAAVFAVSSGFLGPRSTPPLPLCPLQSQWQSSPNRWTANMPRRSPMRDRGDGDRPDCRPAPLF